LFRIFFDHRNSDGGRGAPEHGIQDISIVEEYAQALEQAHEKLRTWGWPELSYLPGRVYVYSIHRRVSGYAMPGRFRSAPYLGLNSGGTEVWPEQARGRRKATAAHELTHLFHFEFQLPRSWWWLDEASATAMEPLVFEGNTRYLRHLHDWFRHPEKSLDTGLGYEASLLITYLVDRFDESIVPAIYSVAGASDRPLGAIEALAEAIQGRAREQGGQEVLASATRDDIFGSGYCCDAYFLRNPVRPCFDQALYQAYGERAITETFHEYPVKDAAGNDPIDHLGCRYYRFRPKEGNSHLTVTVDLHDAHAQKFLRGELIGVGPDMRPVERATLARPQARDIMRAGMDGFAPQRADHAVLVLSNCAWGFGAPDGLTFRISAELC